MALRERLVLQLDPDERAASTARHRIVAAAGERLDGEGRETLGLLVSEVVTNAVRHGSKRGHVDVIASLSPGTIRVEVRDQGEGFVPRPRALEPDHVGGWGLFLVEQLATAWGVAFNGRTKVWFELSYPEPPDTA